MPEARRLPTEKMMINVGPSHPAMHGAIRAQIEVDGETIVDSRTEFGYLHRGFEKHSEESTYTQVIPYTDRLNYVSALMNNVGYCRAVEKSLGIEIPDRAQFIRVIINELSRIIDHQVSIGANLVDMGALTNFWYFFNPREDVYEMLEKLTGARLTNTYTRVGGVARDLYPGFEDDLKVVLKKIRKSIKDVKGLVAKNRIFIDRSKGIGIMPPERAISYGWTGPCLRACGINHDLRKKEPYYHYDEIDFDIPLGENGDTYDRINVRWEEMDQSIRIIEQVMKKMPGGPIMVKDPGIALPPKQEVYGSIEGLMNHFKLIMEGIKVQPGEVYSATEVANGELGFLLISDGSGNPYRLKVRPPCFCFLSSFDELIKGHMMADVVIILGSLNIIAGELDR